MKSFDSKVLVLLCSIFFSILVMWQLLLPGYVLALDAIFGPQSGQVGLVKFYSQGSVFGLGIYLASLVMPIWVFEKIFLFGLFVALLFIPYCAISNILKLYRLDYGTSVQDISQQSRYHIAAFSGALFYAINPFVYERFIAGQWLLLAGYVFIPSVLQYTLTNQRIKLVVSLLLISFFSLHVLSLAFIIYLLSLLIVVVGFQNIKAAITQAARVTVIFFICSIWYIPRAIQYALSFSSNQTEGIGLFTNSGSVYGRIFESVTLQGFWLTHARWSNDFAIPFRDFPAMYFTAGLLAIIVIIIGYWSLLTDSRNKKIILLLVTVLSIGVVCSSFWGAISRTIEKSIQIIPVAFRDSNKWSIFIILSYSLLYSAGIFVLVRAKYKKIFISLLLSIPIFITPSIFFGGSGSLNSVWYTKDWEQVSQFYQPGCKILILPWHQYYSQSFLDYRLTANPAAHLSKCEVVTSVDAGVPGGHTNAGLNTENDVIRDYLSKPENDEAFISNLKMLGFTHVVYAMDVVGEDQYQYTFLTKLKPINSYANPISNSVLLFLL